MPLNPSTATAYGLIWKTISDLHLGPPDNPLADLIQDVDGDGTVEVLIKPNHVEYFNDLNGQRSPCYSHPATIRPLVDMLARAEENLRAERVTLCVDRQGVKQAQASEMAPEITLATLHNSVGRSVVVRLIRIEPRTCTNRPANGWRLKGTSITKSATGRCRTEHAGTI